MTEILASAEEYSSYKTRSLNVLDRGEDEVGILGAFDICLYDSATGEEVQPESPVRVLIDRLDSGLKYVSDLSVIHFGKEPEIMITLETSSGIEFETTGFSVYTIVGREGGTIEVPRVEFHFIDSNFTETTTQGTDGSSTYKYEASGYKFYNKHNEYQISQILRNGETLESIANPPNKKGENDEKYIN